MTQKTENKSLCCGNCCCCHSPCFCKKIRKLWCVVKDKVFKSYYALKVLGISLILGSMVYYITYFRGHESTLSDTDRYCLNNPNPACDKVRLTLSKKRLVNKQIENRKLTRCMCRNVALYSSQIKNSDFRAGNFYQAYLDGVTISSSDFFKSFFYGAIFKNVVFENSELGGSVFNFADFENTEFKNVNLQSAVFIGARFNNSYYDSKTKLPFSKEQARKKGLFPLSEKINKH